MTTAMRATAPIKVALEYLDFVRGNPFHRIAAQDYIVDLAQERRKIMREAYMFYVAALGAAYLLLSVEKTESVTISAFGLQFAAPISQSLLAAATTFFFMFFCQLLGSATVAQHVLYVASMPRHLFERTNVDKQEVEEAELNELYVADIDARLLVVSAIRQRRHLFHSGPTHKTASALFMLASLLSSLLQLGLVVAALASFTDAQIRFSIWHLFGWLCITQVTLSTLLSLGLFMPLGFGRKIIEAQATN